MNDIQPIQLAKTESRELSITWSDGFEQTVSFRQLRSACQCATCQEKKISKSDSPPGQLNILSAAEARPLEVLSMKPVGNYAYNIEFSDGHTSGIFSFELLRTLQ